MLYKSIGGLQVQSTTYHFQPLSLFSQQFHFKKKHSKRKKTHTKISTLTLTLVISTILCTFRISCGSTGITQGQAVPFISWWIPSGHWITFSQKFFIIHGTNQWTIVFTSVGLFGFVDGANKLTQKTTNPQKHHGNKIKHHTLSFKGVKAICSWWFPKHSVS